MTRPGAAQAALSGAARAAAGPRLLDRDAADDALVDGAAERLEQLAAVDPDPFHRRGSSS